MGVGVGVSVDVIDYGFERFREQPGGVVLIPCFRIVGETSAPLRQLDISDEFKSSIEMLKGHDDKIRVVLNKADLVRYPLLSAAFCLTLLLPLLYASAVVRPLLLRGHS